jgi:hypothetical protein
MSKLETNTIDTVSGTSTLQVGSTNTSTITLGVRGDTVNVPSGVTIANSGTATGFGGVNTPYFYAFNNANQSVSDATVTQVRFNEEVVDTASAFNVSTYRFTPQTAGYYQLHTQVGCDAQNPDSIDLAQIFIRKNGTNITNSFVDGRNDEVGYAQTPSVSVVVQANGSSDYFDVTGYVDSSSGSQQFNGSSSNPSTFFYGFKLI